MWCTSFPVPQDICTEYLNPSDLAPLVACRLITLDKCHGVRPIGIGECAWWIICKAIASVLSLDILDTVGSQQLCAGHTSGCEAAVHVARSIFTDPATEAFLMVDATNAFNSQSKGCPEERHEAVSPALVNTYRSGIDLFIRWRNPIFTWGDYSGGSPCYGNVYHSNCAPIIKRISNDNVKQSWYADATAAGGILSGLRKWWDDLAKIGPDYGYFPNAKKTHLWLKITWTWSMPPDPPSFACLLLMYAYCSCMLTYTSDTHVTPLLKILATGLIKKITLLYPGLLTMHYTFLQHAWQALEYKNDWG